MGNVAQLAVLPASGSASPFLNRFGGWKTIILLMLIGWLYVPILVPLVRQWWIDPNFSHGFFVPLFSGFVVWQKRLQFASIPRVPSSWGLAVILVAVFTLVLGVFGAELFFSRVSLLMLIGGLVIFFLG